MSLVVPQTAVQRVVPDAILGRITAIFLTGEAVASLVGAVAGPAIAQLTELTGLAAVASGTTLAAAVLTLLLVPAMSANAPLAAILSGASAYGSGVNVGLGAERLELAARGAARPGGEG